MVVPKMAVLALIVGQLISTGVHIIASRVAVLMLGVQGRTTTVYGARVSAAMYHAPLFHESGRRGEAERVNESSSLSSGLRDPDCSSWEVLCSPSVQRGTLVF